MVIQTRDRVFVFEIKYNADAETAIKQIEERKYYERYKLLKKKIVLVGISFNRTKDHLTLDYKTKELG